MTVEDMRRKLCIRHNLFDSDICDDMNAARLDMSRVGIDVELDDALVNQAVELFVKSKFDYLGKGERFDKSYKELRDSMSVSKIYRKQVDT